jgi:integrase
MARKKFHNSGSLVNKGKRLSSNIIKAALELVNKSRDRTLLLVLSETGCTLSELVNIKVGDISHDSIAFGSRRVEISKVLWEEAQGIIKGKEKSEFLFSSRQSKQLDARRVQQIIKESLGASPSKVRQQRIREIAKEKGCEAANRSSGISWLKQKASLTEDEIQKVRSHIQDTGHLLMLDILLETGCLLSELVELRAEDIASDSIILSQKRKVRVRGNLVSRLMRFTDGRSGFIFSSRQSDNISDKRVFQILQSYGRAAQVELNQRVLRNTKIARMLSGGEDRAKIESELGIRRLEFGSYGLLDES